MQKQRLFLQQLFLHYQKFVVPLLSKQQKQQK